MSRISYYGHIHFEMEPYLIDGLELWINRFAESTLERNSDKTCTLKVNENLTKSVNFMYFLGTYLNTHANILDGNVILRDDKDTEMDEFILVEKQFKERSYDYSEEKKQEISVNKLVSMVSETDKICNTSNDGVQTEYGDRLFDVFGLDKGVSEVVNGLVSDVNLTKDGKYVIYFEEGLVRIEPTIIWFLPFLPEEVTELKYNPFTRNYGEDFLNVPFRAVDSEHSGMNYKGIYFPFQHEYIYPGVMIKHKEKWVHSCDLCINRLDSLINGGICKGGCNPKLIESPEMDSV